MKQAVKNYLVFVIRQESLRTPPFRLASHFSERTLSSSSSSSDAPPHSKLENFIADILLT